MLIDPDDFFNDLGNWRMKLSNKDKSMLDLEEWDAREVGSFEAREESLGGFDSGVGFYLEWLPNSGEEEWAVGWWT